MGRGLAFVYGFGCYGFFLLVFLFFIGWLANYPILAFLGDYPFLTLTIDSGAPAGGLIGAAAVNLALITLFGLQHTVMARPGFKQAWTRIVPRPIERSTYVLISSALLVLLFWQWRPMTGSVWMLSNAPVQITVTALFAAGWAVILLATFLISHFDLFGLNQVYAYLLRREPPVYKFAQPLLYKIVRHPLMLGFLMVFWAAPAMTVGHLLFAAGMTAYILIALPYEERDLVTYLGQEYIDYQNSVPKILPLTKPGGSPAKSTGEA